MSVVVRMEMPESCKKCKATLCLWTIDDCEIMDTIAAVQDFRKENDDGFPEFCPIICQLPEGHGRLVDADELESRCRPVKNFENTDSLVIGVGPLRCSKTIVPAEGERSET